MRRFAPLVPRRYVCVRLFLGMCLAAGLAITTIQAQIPGRNVNMVSGVKWPEGDPFLQRQNEPSVAASTRNPLHLLGGSNDYRTVDVPGTCLEFGPDPADPARQICVKGPETGDAWLGLFKSFDGGQRWTSTLLPGYPQDDSPAGLASPLRAKPDVPGSGYQAGADAVVRAGTNGLLYFSGLVFDRAEDGKSGIFLARFIDNNNQEAGDPIAYLGATMVAQSSGAKFLDKPWMAVDIPRNNAVMCTITDDSIIPTAQNGRRRRHGYDRHERSNNGRGANRGRGGAADPGTQRIPAGAVYVAYSSITGDAAALRSEILLTRSMDCGATWSAPIRVSRPEDQINQGSSLTIDPRTGAVYVGWRRFDPDLTDTNDLDGIMVARLPFGAKAVEAPSRAHGFAKPARKVGRQLHRLFEHRENRFKNAQASEANENLDQFDLGTSGYNFRTNAYPTMAADGTGRVYLAWTQRGFAADSGVADGARIVIATTRDGRSFTAPQPVDDHAEPGRGHQLMPSMAFAGGKLMLVFYDLRDSKAQTHNRVSSDFGTNSRLRQTIDIRSAMGSPGDTPVFTRSVKVSDYLLGFNPKSGEVEELQVNPPNLPMFKLGTVPFIGDYIDVAAAPAFVPTANGKWAYNNADTGEIPVFHAVWTDNRDVRPPRDGNWRNYAPPTKMTPEQLNGLSLFDGSPVAQCVDGAGNPGSRNQNVYSARITGGLLAGSPGNAKPLSPELQRGFVVFAQNTTAETRSFRMTILSQPVGGRASFEQFPLPPYTIGSPAPETAIEMIVPPRSTAARTVYVTSTDVNAQLSIDVSELVDLRTLTSAALYPTAPELTDGLEARVVLNPDIENPDIENPDIENPDIENPDIENSEVYNPDIENPDIENPDIENPDIENPDIENPDIENPDIENPDIENVRVANPDIENPDIENPDIENPDIENPDIENPDIENGAIADITWKVSNDGNTTASFNVNLFLAQQTLPAGVTTQLVLLKTYRTPVTAANRCQLSFQTRNILLANIRNPRFTQPSSGGIPDQNDPAESNATLWLAPGEEGRITLRVVDDDTSNNLIIAKTNDDGSPQLDEKGNQKFVSVDPAFAPTTSSTPTISSQGVGTEAANEGETDPPLVTPTGSNLFFLQMPTSTVAGAVIAPAVSVQVRDNLTGTPVPGATVTLSLGSAVLDASLSGHVAVADLNGIATFSSLAVSLPGSGYQLMATATTGTVTATAVSTPFDIFAATVVVTTADGGFGSLRAAMLAANATPGVQTITFNIPGASPTSPAVVAVQTPLPTISSTMIIDGRTQPGYDDRPVVEVTWAGAAPGTNGFTIDFDQTDVQILALAITNFPGFGIQSLQTESPGGGRHQIRFNTIGTDRFSAGGKGNGTGIEMRTDDAVVEANVVSGNSGTGVLVMNDADRVLIAGNRIGTSLDGLAALPNNTGIVMFDTLNDIELRSNLISGNAGYGVDIQSSNAGDVTGTRLHGNRIGLSDDGSALGNGSGGVRINNAPDTIIGTPGPGGNVISANGGIGVAVHGAASTGVLIQGNRIGSDPNGTAPRGNTGPGVRITAAGVEVGWRNSDPPLSLAGNLISGNGGDGVQLLGAGATGNKVRGNRIGTDAAGTAALGNGTTSFSNFQAIYVTGPSNTIGGALDEERNLLSGNVVNGVFLHNAAATGNLVQGNFIGTNAAGTGAIANGFDGVGLIQAPNNTVAGNLVSGNARFGFFVSGANNQIDGNEIGTAAGGVTALGNLAGGIHIVSNGTRVGVTAPNVIAFNSGSGVVVATGTGNQIANNNIHANTQLGIDLAGNGLTPNDPGDTDGGPNELQNFPVLSNARNPVGSNTMVDFETNTFAVGSYTLRFFAGVCDGNGHGEGARQVGVTNSVGAGASGAIVLSEVVPAGQSITATATDAAGNTSEFSACSAITAAPGGGSAYFVPGEAGGTANTNTVGAGGIDPVSAGVVADGQVFSIQATGSVSWYSDRTNLSGPDGVLPPQPDFLAPSLTGISLVARIGNGPWQFIGSGPTMIGGPGSSGLLQLAVNDSFYGSRDGFDESNTGGFNVTVTRVVTVVGPAGGSGGSPFGPVDCPAGSLVVGFQGRAGQDIDQTSIMCASLPSLAGTGTFLAQAGGGGMDYGATLSCGAGQVVTGVFGEVRSPGYIDRLGVTCTPLAGGASANLGPVAAFDGGTAFALACPGSKKVVGIEGRDGALMDQISIRCQ